MDMLWEKFHWILPLYMKPIFFQSKASVVCSVITALFIDFCLKKLNVFSQHIGTKTNEYLDSTQKITRNWNVNLVSALITSWDITWWCRINLLWKDPASIATLAQRRGIGRHRRDRQPTSRQCWYSVACVATVCRHSVSARRLAYRSLPMFCVWTLKVWNQVFLK